MIEDNYHTYFISFVSPNDTGFHVGNLTFRTEATGELLVLDAINMAEHEREDAVLISICKVD